MADSSTNNDQNLNSGHPCDFLLESLKSCLLRSDCVLKQNLKPSTCLKEHLKELPDECQQLRQAHFACKRGMLDTRNRFRGNASAGAAPQSKKEPSD